LNDPGQRWQQIVSRGPGCV